MVPKLGMTAFETLQADVQAHLMSGLFQRLFCPQVKLDYGQFLCAWLEIQFEFVGPILSFTPASLVLGEGGEGL